MFRFAVISFVLSLSLTAHAQPTVIGNTISWPDDGWYQVQSVTTFTSLCEGGRSCDVPFGTYIVINHTSGQRWKRVEVVQNGPQSQRPTTDGATIRWADDGWYQVQRADTYISICEGGRSCAVDPGRYIVINHSTGQRWEDIDVSDIEDGSTAPVVTGQTISWADDGWYQVQTASDYISICEGGQSCRVEPGSYIVINHTTGERWKGITVERAPTDHVPLPQKTGEQFVVENWDYVVTSKDLGVNFFSGNAGKLGSSQASSIGIDADSFGSVGGSLLLNFDFSTDSGDSFVGYFTSLFGLTETLVSFDGEAQQPPEPTTFPGYALDFSNLFGALATMQDRSIEELQFDIKNLSDAPLQLKIELKDERGQDVFMRVDIGGGSQWQTIVLTIPTDFSDSLSGAPENFDWGQVDAFALVVEDRDANPERGRILLDNLRLNDVDGSYPDLAAVAREIGTTTIYDRALFDHLEQLSFLYFLDWSSTDPRSGGLIQDRSTFADLLTVGGVFGQLPAYVIGAERGYVDRTFAAQKTRDLLRVLEECPQGHDRVGTAGYQGFFYHFLNIDCGRKQNFDFDATPDVNEAHNTVELSTIDTALAIAGIIVSGEYFTEDTPIEHEIRERSLRLFARVNWPFLLEPQTNQFYLGWKPNDDNEDSLFAIPDALGLGTYSGNSERAQTLDFYTDEALLVTLLAMASPESNYRVDKTVWESLERETGNGDFIKTYPGSLFTYFFFRMFVDTCELGRESDVVLQTRVDFCENSTKAIQATIDYVCLNPNGRRSFSELAGASCTTPPFGLTAIEGPFEEYFADAAPVAGIANDETVTHSSEPLVIEGEAGASVGSIKIRGAASGQETLELLSGQSARYEVVVPGSACYAVHVRYSNDHFGVPLEQVSLRLGNSLSLGSFQAQDTGDLGEGWNVFVEDHLGVHCLEPGKTQLTVDVSEAGDRIEIDAIVFAPQSPPVVVRPLETGNITNYGVVGSLPFVPDTARNSLFHQALTADLNQDGEPDLLHPRFGLADAANVDIGDAVIPGITDCGRYFRCSGAWLSYSGFAINHGPSLIMLDEQAYGDGLVTRLFMNHPAIKEQLDLLFSD